MRGFVSRQFNLNGFGQLIQVDYQVRIKIAV